LSPKGAEISRIHEAEIEQDRVKGKSISRRLRGSFI